MLPDEPGVDVRARGDQRGRISRRLRWLDRAAGQQPDAAFRMPGEQHAIFRVAQRNGHGRHLEQLVASYEVTET